MKCKHGSPIADRIVCANCERDKAGLRERRERIATVCLAAHIASPNIISDPAGNHQYKRTPVFLARCAVEHVDALIAELDK